MEDKQLYQAFKEGYLKNVTPPIQKNDKQRAEYHAAAYVRKLKREQRCDSYYANNLSIKKECLNCGKLLTEHL